MIPNFCVCVWLRVASRWARAFIHLSFVRWFRWDESIRELHQPTVVDLPNMRRDRVWVDDDGGVAVAVSRRYLMTLSSDSSTDGLILRVVSIRSARPIQQQQQQSATTMIPGAPISNYFLFVFFFISQHLILCSFLKSSKGSQDDQSHAWTAAAAACSQCIQHLDRITLDTQDNNSSSRVVVQNCIIQCMLWPIRNPHLAMLRKTSNSNTIL